MKSSFAANITNDVASRNYGGTNKGIAEPYITGYHFIHWDSFPSGLTVFGPSGSNNNGGPGTALATSKVGTENAATFLEASCLSVTPPGGTLNKTEFVGLGGVKWSVPTNIDYGNTLTMRFLEYSGLPVLTIMHSWVKLIRDYRTGTTLLQDGNYNKQSYAGTVYYWTTRPDGRTIEYAACYTGVFPTKDPQDLFTGDLTAVDKLEIDIDFNVDWVWHEKWVYDACDAFANTAAADLVQRGTTLSPNGS